MRKGIRNRNDEFCLLNFSKDNCNKSIRIFVEPNALKLRFKRIRLASFLGGKGNVWNYLSSDRLVIFRDSRGSFFN